MKIALPMAQGRLCMHFGHCEQFALIDVSVETNEIKAIEYMTPPPHEPGVLPAWLAGLGANCIIAGGMGQMAQNLFFQSNITVITGAPPEDPKKIVRDYLEKQLVTGENLCNSGDHDCNH